MIQQKQQIVQQLIGAPSNLHFLAIDIFCIKLYFQYFVDKDETNVVFR